MQGVLQNFFLKNKGFKRWLKFWAASRPKPAFCQHGNRSSGCLVPNATQGPHLWQLIYPKPKGEGAPARSLFSQQLLQGRGKPKQPSPTLPSAQARQTKQKPMVIKPVVFAKCNKAKGVRRWFAQQQNRWFAAPGRPSAGGCTSGLCQCALPHTWLRPLPDTVQSRCLTLG